MKISCPEMTLTVIALKTLVAKTCSIANIENFEP